MDTKKFALTKHNSGHSRQCVEMYEKIFSEQATLNRKKAEAVQNVKRLESELQESSNQMLFSLGDDAQSKAITDRRRILQFELEDQRLIAGADVDRIIKQKYEQVVSNADISRAIDEGTAYWATIDDEIDRLTKVHADEVKELKRLKELHPASRLSGLMTRFSSLGRR